MRIRNLTFINFKKIASDRLIEFNDDINVLVGANNAGKTSILQALAFAFNLSVPNFNQNDAIYYLVKDGVCKIDVDFLFNEREWEICFSQIKHNYPNEDFTEFPKELSGQILKKSITLNVVNKQIKGDSRELKMTGTSSEFAKSKQRVIQNALGQLLHQNFHSFFGTPLFIDSNRSIMPKEEFRAIQSVRQENNPQQIRSKLYVIQKDNPERFESIKKHVLNVFPEIEDFSIRHDEERAIFSLQIKEKFKKNGDFEDVNYDIHNTGLGMQSLILIIANIFVQDSDVVLLDEPEIHMHPDLISKFIDIIQKISSDKQIILTSHSVPLINAVKPDKLFSLKYFSAEKGVIVKPVKEKKEVIDILDDIGFDLKNDVFSNEFRSKTVVFTEGVTDKDYLMGFAKRFKDKLNISDNFYYPFFESMDGKGDSFKYAAVIKKLKEQTGIKIVITVDKDEQSNDWLKNNLDDDQLHIWGKRQIENYLLNPAVIAGIVNADKKEIKDKLEAVIDSQKEDMLHRFIKELFFEWKLSDTESMRLFLDRNKGKNFEEYETELEQMFSNRLIELKNNTKEKVKNIEKYFNEKWEKEKWDICDGKRALKDFRRDNYSFSNEEIIEKMEDCPEDIKNFWIKISGLV